MSNTLRNIITSKFYIYDTLSFPLFWRGQCYLHRLKWYSLCFCFVVFFFPLAYLRERQDILLCALVHCWRENGALLIWEVHGGSNSEMQSGEGRNVYCRMNFCLQEQAWGIHGRTETASSPQGNGAGRKRVVGGWGWGYRKAGPR